MHKYQKLVAESFEVLFDAEKTVDDVRPFFVKNYTQWVDGKSLDYNGFFQHVVALKEVIATAHVEFIEFMVAGDTAADIHDVFVTKKNGETLHVRVIAFFTFENDQIASVREMTHLLEGNESDHDLGSRT
ncbi:nuclear transport factor 2 family protein [Wohlfahrtiimonas populi]|uniref:nuclear transport factor 2 family protein n=1 Tax=Wohlfahrtiimonas populi TaxID=1940240 RepID=UPI00098D6C04|nr:nuclear transport factor 2 family protein [Wohlfahrtiimonas populi]